MSVTEDLQVPEKIEKPKRTVRQFLNQYRSLGLPNAKKFRRRTRIESLTAERNFYIDMVKQASLMNAQANHLLRELIKEQNFALDEANNNTILWVADDSAINNAKKYLSEFTAGRTRPPQQSIPPAATTAPSGDAASTAPTAQDGQP